MRTDLSPQCTKVITTYTTGSTSRMTIKAVHMHEMLLENNYWRNGDRQVPPHLDLHSRATIHQSHSLYSYTVQTITVYTPKTCIGRWGCARIHTAGPRFTYAQRLLMASIMEAWRSTFTGQRRRSKLNSMNQSWVKLRAAELRRR